MLDPTDTSLSDNTPSSAPTFSASDKGSAVGVFIAVTAVAILHARGIDMPAGWEALAGSACTAITGFLTQLITNILRKKGYLQ